MTTWLGSYAVNLLFSAFNRRRQYLCAFLCEQLLSIGGRFHLCTHKMRDKRFLWFQWFFSSVFWKLRLLFQFRIALETAVATSWSVQLNISDKCMCSFPEHSFILRNIWNVWQMSGCVVMCAFYLYSHLICLTQQIWKWAAAFGPLSSGACWWWASPRRPPLICESEPKFEKKYFD